MKLKLNFFFCDVIQALQEARVLHGGVEKVQPRQQEGSRPIRELLGAKGEADWSEGGAYEGLPINHRPDLPSGPQEV